MGIAERRAREKDEIRRRIMEAAVELFLQSGYGSVSMRKIAEKIEYAPSTIYLYFKNKTEIIAAICAATFETLIDGLEEIEQRGLPPLEQIEAGMRWYVSFGLDNPYEYQLVFSNSTPEDVAQMNELSQLGLRALSYLARDITRCRAAGMFAPGDDLKDSMATWSQLHGVTSVIITDYGKHSLPWPPREELIDRGIQLILRGLRS